MTPHPSTRRKARRTDLDRRTFDWLSPLPLFNHRKPISERRAGFDRRQLRTTAYR